MMSLTSREPTLYQIRLSVGSARPVAGDAGIQDAVVPIGHE
jgi:hypothetical protein